MNQTILQAAYLSLLITSLMGVLLHDTHLDSAITKLVASKDDIIVSKVTQRSPHVHSHEGSVLENIRALKSSRQNAKRNKGENEKKYLIQKRKSSRTLSSDAFNWPSE